jgi:GDP-D-mannose 3',5'-epimerase
MKIAITGHRGFIGSHVAKRVEALGHEVVRVEGDVREVDLPATDGFMHFAAKMGGVGFFSTQQFEPILDNLTMDARVIQHCRKHGSRLLYPSSACAYPVRLMERGVPLSEDLLSVSADPDQMYGMEKLCITRLSEFADFDFRVPVLHTIYGEGQDYLDSRVKFPPQICYKFATADFVEVWGDGSQTRTFLHIDDATEMLLEIFFDDRYHGPVNVSHPREVSVREVVDVLSAHTGRTDISYDPTKPTGPTRRPVDNAKFYSHYAWRPRVDIAEGFTRLYEYIVRQVHLGRARSDNR